MSRAKTHAAIVADTLAHSRPTAQVTADSPNRIATLQLYRHLLREVSYLPPAIRQNIQDPVRKRFHQHKGEDPREKQHLRRANNALRSVRAANSGDKQAMQAIILKSFGRAWIRRHGLLKDTFTREDVRSSAASPATPAATATIQNSTDLERMTNTPDVPAVEPESRPMTTDLPDAPQKRKIRPFERLHQPKTIAMLQSQSEARGVNPAASWSGRVIKNVDPDSRLPKENIWGKPPAKELLQTKRNSWWKLQMAKIMPPVPKDEWELLGKLAQGHQEQDALRVPQRRTRVPQVASEDATSSDAAWDWERYTEGPIARVERGRNRLNQRRTSQAPIGPFGHALQPHTQSDRWFRRAYEQTWGLTSYEKQNPETRKWSFVWGGNKAKRVKPTRLQMSVFDGVDAQGKLPEQPRKAKR